jgi:protein-arginine deiminase
MKPNARDSDALKRQEGASISSEDIILVGQKLLVSLSRFAPIQTAKAVVSASSSLEVADVNNNSRIENGAILKADSIISLLASAPSNSVNDRSITLSFQDDSNNLIQTAVLSLTCVYISLDVDADRDGKVESNNPNKANWTFGKQGHGAILLVNNDIDSELISPTNPTVAGDRRDRTINGPLDLDDMSPMVIEVEGPATIPNEFRLFIQLTDLAANRIRIFQFKSEITGTPVIGPDTPQAEVSYRAGKTRFVAEGLSYPDRGFTGLVSVSLVLLRESLPLATDTVVFRVAPWLMTPNVLMPETVYVCRLEDGSNEKFLSELKGLVADAGVNLVVCEPSIHRGDRWMQDEIEIGYSQSPTKVMPVVLDSPRNRQLDIFPEEQLIGSDFGYVTRQEGLASSLDSFGNLEVSPPVESNGQNFPFGRIITGSALPTVGAGRRVMQVVKDFLYAQQLQAPIELFTDWLVVGHVDEFMTFVPTASSSKGFKLLLASPRVCYKLLGQLDNSGSGSEQLFSGRELPWKEDVIGQYTTVSSLLMNREIRLANDLYQSYIDYNKGILKDKLGLIEKDIIELPLLYFGSTRCSALFSNVVNMIVVGKHLGIGKPYGPVIGGICQFERYIKSVLEPLGLICHFLDDWNAYFLNMGGVHCGTNTRRKAFETPWWF